MFAIYPTVYISPSQPRPYYLYACLNRKYDVCSCLSQSEDINTGVLSVKTEFMKVYVRACHEDSPSIPIGKFISDHS